MFNPFFPGSDENSTFFYLKKTKLSKCHNFLNNGATELVVGLIDQKCPLVFKNAIKRKQSSAVIELWAICLSSVRRVTANEIVNSNTFSYSQIKRDLKNVV